MNTKKLHLDDLLLIFRRNIVAGLKKEGLQQELTFSQIEVLHFIGSSGAQTMKAIAEFLSIAPPSATEIIAEMEKKGLVTRSGDTRDRRIIHIKLTPLAKKLLQSVSRKKKTILKKMISVLNQKDQKTLERIIRIIITQ